MSSSLFLLETLPPVTPCVFFLFVLDRGLDIPVVYKQANKLLQSRIATKNDALYTKRMQVDTFSKH